jgi:Protein of unknown function (DUF1579)
MTLVVCTLSVAAVAQGPVKPGPEHARIGYFAGEWKFEGESEGLKFTLTQSCEWFEGGFHLVCRGGGTSDLGPVKDHMVFGYDRGAKSYTLHSINSLGNAISAKGSLRDKVWTWDTELAGAQGPLQARLTLTEQSATAYTIKLEGLMGTQWMVLEAGRATKLR